MEERSSNKRSIILWLRLNQFALYWLSLQLWSYFRKKKKSTLYLENRITRHFLSIMVTCKWKLWNQSRWLCDFTHLESFHYLNTYVDIYLKLERGAKKYKTSCGASRSNIGVNWSHINLQNSCYMVNMYRYRIFFT